MSEDPQGLRCSSISAEENAAQLIRQGRNTFRFDTFGDEDYWGGKLGLDKLIEGAANGGVGPGVSPAAALALGLKVDVDALPRALREQIQNGDLDLNNPANTVALIRLNAVLGLKGFFNSAGQMTTIGIQCALCHSTVDNSFAPGIGHRLDGWANRDLNVGAIVASTPGIKVFADALHKTVDETKRILLAWGPGKFDAELALDGKGFQPNGQSSATLIPPAFGLAGFNLHTWVGWGSVPHWNAFVANIEMHGKGKFFDARLDDASKWPLAAAEGLGHINIASDEDRVTPQLPALQVFQLSIPVPRPAPGSFDPEAAERGDALFSGKAKCNTCHFEPTYTDSGWNVHTPEEVGVDGFQARRGPEDRYRTAPLRALLTHAKGGFYHYGQFATLTDVVEHYNDFLHLGLTPAEIADLVEYLKSL